MSHELHSNLRQCREHSRGSSPGLSSVTTRLGLQGRASSKRQMMLPSPTEPVMGGSFFNFLHEHNLQRDKKNIMENVD